jgi:hypothetical protein
VQAIVLGTELAAAILIGAVGQFASDLLELLLGGNQFIEAALGHLIYGPVRRELGLLLEEADPCSRMMLHAPTVRTIQSR